MSDTNTNPEPDTDTTPEQAGADTDTTPEQAGADTDTTPEQAGADTDTTPEQAEAPSGDKAAREAAKYRKRLREAEAERDRLAAQVEALQRAEIERLSLDKHRVKGAALWAAGYQVTDLVDDDGRPDEAKVRKAAEEAAERFGIDRRGGVYVPAEGRTPELAPQISWGQLLHPNRP